MCLYNVNSSVKFIFAFTFTGKFIIEFTFTNALLSIIRNYVNKHILKTIYFAIFGSYMNYPNLIYVEPKPTCIE